jgi:hypothetical protein
MRFPSNCFVGRIVIRYDRLGGFDWTIPCPVPPETCVPTVPPMFFCVRHGDAIYETLYEAYQQLGLIDHSVVALPMDDFDRLVEAQGLLADEPERPLEGDHTDL